MSDTTLPEPTTEERLARAIELLQRCMKCYVGRGALLGEDIAEFLATDQAKGSA